MIDMDWYHGERNALRRLFALADDSEYQVREYLHLGRVVVATRTGALLGHAQLVPAREPGEVELRSIAVMPHERLAGVGSALVSFALQRCAEEGWSRMIVATAAADTGNLRFYQRLGFRMLAIERDAFTPAIGYPKGMTVDGIPLLDRVWLAQDLASS